MEVSGRSATFPGCFTHRSQWIRGYVGLRERVDILQKRQISCPCHDSNPITSTHSLGSTFYSSQVYFLSLLLKYCITAQKRTESKFQRTYSTCYKFKILVRFPISNISGVIFSFLAKDALQVHYSLCFDTITWSANKTHCNTNLSPSYWSTQDRHRNTCWCLIAQVRKFVLCLVMCIIHNIKYAENM